MQAELSQTFESSCGLTPQWKSTFTKVKRLFKKSFADVADNIELNRGHFYFYGFLTRKTDGQIFYFSISDVRHFPCTQLLIRTAENYKDFSGGQNQFVTMDGNFSDNLKHFLKNN